MPITVHRHHGPWDQSTRKIRPLKYLEDYISEVTSDFRLLYPNTKYYSPDAIFHDNAATFHGANDIKAMMKLVFGKFEKASMEPRYLQVIDETEGEKALYTVIGELMVSYYIKGDAEPVLAPRLMVFTIMNGTDSEAYDGLVFSEVYLSWNVGIVKDEVARRANLRHEN
ncbi:uncharacterized protein LY89DRAFT_739245 [Mollisia scopiformis]|uniref:SnoaL-like domain-containing protein n=1 Tax=Mollisia scopiformis TaxID=149040 RepID=A0A194WSU5_MOLSC|nr:uncharacterized protein LY89DRAFT_739245 [Mollisia scopiformis]KUJ11030.1 hypothetical protein LY89DRAFT_739245 [Mollisia scopiformis]